MGERENASSSQERMWKMVLNISVLFGSPRTGGNSETLAEKILDHAPAGSGIERFFLAQRRLEGCRDCRRCWTGGTPCVLQDDMAEIYHSLEKADLIFFVTPLYWYSWSAPIKTVWDRLLPYNAASALRVLRGKKAALVVAAADDDATCFEGVRFSLRRSCDLLGLTVVGEICEGELAERGDVLRRPALGLKLAEQASRLFL